MAPHIPSPDDDDSINPTVAVAIDKDKNSQFALKWAIDHLPLINHTIILIHVMGKNYQTDGSSHGSNDSSKDLSESNHAKQLFLPFRGFCARKGIIAKEIVLEDTDVARAIADYIDSNFINQIALGASHRNALTRNFMKRQDVPTMLTKLAPDFCGVYVISKMKAITIRSASRPAPIGAQFRHQSSSMGHDQSDPENSVKSMFTRGPSRRGELGQPPLERRPPAFDNRSNEQHQIHTPPKDRLRFTKMIIPKSNNNFAKEIHDRSIRTPRTLSNDHSYHGHTPRFDSTNENLEFSDEHSPMSAREIELEMMRLKQELQQTMDMYSKACKEAISAKQKAQELQQWKMEESHRYEQARFSEEAALELAKTEQAKYKAANEAAAMSQKLAEMEARKRMEAEIRAHREAEERDRAVRSLAKNDVRYRKYSIQEIEAATDNFSESLKIGEGGYGPVYGTNIDHTAVAVKILKSDASQGMQQFQQEVEILSCIRHPNMVLLLGACPENGCLVYEYMDNGSLEDRLFRRGDSPTIPWSIRFKIAAEITTALLFLHKTKPEPLVHRDLKPGNILLDRNYTSKISDVGLARLVPPSVADSVTQYRMTSAAGTFCYIDPEYQQTGMLGIKSDVYSLGIMLLQIITAKPPMGLTHYVERSIEKGTFEQMLDPTVPDWPVEEALSFAKIALQCAELRRKDRPDLGTVVFPELNRLRELGMRKSNTGSLYSHTPWSYTALSRPISSVTSQATPTSYMGTTFRSSAEERIRSGARPVADEERVVEREQLS